MKKHIFLSIIVMATLSASSAYSMDIIRNIAGKSIFKAIEKGDLDQVKKLAHKWDVNKITNKGILDKWGNTPLYYACFLGKLDIVNFLLSRDVPKEVKKKNDGPCSFGCGCSSGDPYSFGHNHNLFEGGFDYTYGETTNKACCNNNTALIAACAKGHVEVVRALLNKKGIRVNEKGEGGYTALELCLQKGSYRSSGRLYKEQYLEIVKLLLENGAFFNIGENNTFYRVCLGRPNSFCLEIVKLLLEKGARESINKVVKCEHSEGGEGMTSAHAAAYRKNYEVLELLLPDCTKETIDRVVINSVYSYGLVNMLQKACLDGNAKVVKLLLQKGADINIMNSRNYTALDIACEKGYLEIVKLLLQSGASIGNNTLYHACANGSLGIVKLLLKNGADLNKENSEGWNALCFACNEGHADIVKFLLYKGAVRNQKLPEILRGKTRELKYRQIMECYNQFVTHLSNSLLGKDFNLAKDKVKFIVENMTELKKEREIYFNAFDEFTLKRNQAYKETQDKFKFISDSKNEFNSVFNKEPVIKEKNSDLEFLVKLICGKSIIECEEKEFKLMDSTDFGKLYNQLDKEDFQKIFGVAYKENIYEFVKEAANKNEFYFDEDLMEKHIFGSKMLETKKSGKFADCVVRTLS